MVQVVTEHAFELSPELYAALVNWPSRLKREGPFYQALFQRYSTRRVIDLGCGTGQHAQMLANWGLNVMGVDSSPAMIEYCRQQYGESPQMRWMVGDLEQPTEISERFDAAICVGNSLALVPDRTAMQRALVAMHGILRRGGIAIVQVLNLARFPEGPVVWQTASEVTLGAERRVIVKGIHRTGRRGFIDFVEMTPDGEIDTSRCRSTPFLDIWPGELQADLTASGFKVVEQFGAYDRSPVDLQQSADLICVAVRA